MTPLPEADGPGFAPHPDATAYPQGELVIHCRWKPAPFAAAVPIAAPVVESARASAERYSRRTGLAFAPAMEALFTRRLPGDLAAPAAPGLEPLSRVLRAPVAPADAGRLVQDLSNDEEVEAAYFKPAAEPANLNLMAAAPAEPLASADFTHAQGYLGAAPGGIDAAWAARIPGGRGADVRIIDIEGQWRFSHECFRDRMGGVLSPTVIQNLGWRNHGTAVMGILWGQGRTLTGIVPDSEARGISFGGQPAPLGSAGALLLAGEFLRPGDLLLVELHRPGPRTGFTASPNQTGYVAIEWWPDDRAAIRSLVARGIVVVCAAGNGGEDLDAPLYSVRPAAAPYIFPTTWVNPFNRDGGASLGGLLVGAGASPSGTLGPDRSRLQFSNYGSAVDAQGWGCEVMTAGYGDLQGGSDEDYWYTGQFSGTSSASPIVVGAIAAIQGHLRSAGVQPLSLDEAIDILRATGSPQQANPPSFPVTQRIGNRPDLRPAVNAARALRGLPALP